MATVDQPMHKTTGAQKRSTTPAPIASAPKVHAESAKEDTSKGQGKGEVKDKAKPVGTLNEAACRAGFLKKVYGILTVQLMVTVMIVAVCMYTKPVRERLLIIFNLYSSTLNWGVFIPTFLCLLILKLGAKDKYPANYILLAVLTICISISVGYVCAILEDAGLGAIVLQAFCTSLAMFICLTVYTLLSGKNFSYLKGFLATMLWGLVLTSVAAWFFPALAQSLVFSFIGAITFCGYILYDTSRLVKDLSYDDYIVATIELYLDIINLFLYILDILMKLAAKSKKK
jgi:hypothetical protein